MSEADPAISRRRRLVPFLLIGAVAVISLWFLPGGGADCADIAQCRSSVDLDVSAIPGADDWQARELGMTLSPDESEVAVVLWSSELRERRLALFSTTTGELVLMLENAGANWFANPVYSNDGNYIAAATATFEAHTTDSGEVTVWDRPDIASVRELWAWPSELSPDNELFWNRCSAELGFSNDGRYLVCSSAAEIDTGERIDEFGYEPGFNTLPSGRGTAKGRVVYDPDFTPPAAVRSLRSSAQVEIVRIGDSAGSPAVLELGREEWHRAAVALNGESTTAAIARTWGGTFLDRLAPPFTRPSADLTIASVEDAMVIEMFDLSVEPVTMRFSPSGETIGLLTEDLSLWLLDSTNDG